MNFFILLIMFSFIWGFFVEPKLIVVKHYNVDFLNNEKIVYVSDFHIGKHDKNRLKKIVEKINEQNPDLVLMGGDYIKGHTGRSSMLIDEQAKELAKIKAPKISVLGNHDCWYDKYSVKTALEKAGVIVLLNSSIKSGGLYIAGIDDLKTGIPDINNALEGTDFPRILLTHNPDIYYDVEQKVNLILAGHVHGGQVRIPFFGALICPSKYGTKFSGGDYNETQNRMIVSRGLGTSILPVRFFNIPEIIVLE